MKISFNAGGKPLPARKVEDADETLILDASSSSIEENCLPRHTAERYRIRRSLGKGAFGIVYLAEDRKIGRLVAIKQLFQSHLKDPDIKRRFLQEACIGAQLDHPNIINVFSLEDDETSSCIIMEYLSGGSLESFMEKSGALEPETALRIFRGIVSGLDAAHKVMTIHRDIKPPNILFDHLGEPKISDFGISYQPPSGRGFSSLEERPEKIIGTPRYMSPEQILRQPLDFRSDLYSAGAVLYEMLTGRRIFEFGEDVSIDDIFDTVLHKEPEMPPGCMPDKIADLTRRLLQKDRNRRQRSAQDVLFEIDRLSSPGVKRSSGVETARIGSSGPLLSSPLAMFEDILRLLLVDGIISLAERRELDRRAERLGISQSQSRLIEERVRGEMSLPSLSSLEDYHAIADRLYDSDDDLRLVLEQKKTLLEMRRQLGIHRDQGIAIERQARDDVRLRRKRRRN